MGGAQLASSAVSTTSHPLSCQVVTSPRACAPSAWSPTPLPSLRSSPESIISSILCTPREPSSIGTSVKVWKKVSSPKPERILLPSRRITRRSESRPPKVKVRTMRRSTDQSVTPTPVIRLYVFFHSLMSASAVHLCTAFHGLHHKPYKK